MLHLYDRAAMARALTLDLDPRLRRLLADRIAALNTEYGDLTEHTEYLVVEPGDAEADVVLAVGFSPLIDPIDGGRWPDPGFAPGWDYLADQCAWYEMIYTFGSTHATVLLIADRDGVLLDLLALCRAYS